MFVVVVVVVVVVAGLKKKVVVEVVDVPVLEVRRCRGGPKDARCQPPPGVAPGLATKVGRAGFTGAVLYSLALSDPPSVLPKLSTGRRARTGVPTTRPVQSSLPLAEH